MLHDPRRPYVLRAYYADDVKPPQIPGFLAIEVRWASEHDRDMKADLARKRNDIGKVETFKTS
jgi:hypothetical protein